MAMVQGMQTVLRQLQPSSNFNICRGEQQKNARFDVRKLGFTRFSHQGRKNWHSVGRVYCLKTSEVEQEGKKVDAGTEDWAIKKGLSALDAYFDKLHATSVVEDNTTTSTPTPTPTPISTPITTSTTTPATTSTKTTETPTQSQEASGANPPPSTGLAQHTEKQAENRKLGGLNALDSYFDKLRPSEPEEVDEGLKKVLQSELKKALDESYVDLEKEDEKKVNIKIISASNSPLEEDEEEEYRELMEELEKALEQQAAAGNTIDSESLLNGSAWGLQGGNSTSYLVNGLVALNIAVYLFGLASPLQVPSMMDASLPFVYGAKVNELILNGEWWRLITPTFLHAGLLHLGLSTWALLEFGPAVESAYGTLGFSMIYLIGGLYGNLLSFFHTPQGTVGATGPIYALMATWMVYLLRNREIIGLDVAGDMVRKVVIFTAVVYALCNSFPVDDWTHLGAGAVGIIFGLLTCPLVQVNVHVEDVADNNDEDAMESYLLLNEGLHPYRLFLVFGLSLAIFFALYSVGVPYATEFHFLHGGLGDEYW
jgi:membrane associated rhomboid family serine protease